MSERKKREEWVKLTCEQRELALKDVIERAKARAARMASGGERIDVWVLTPEEIRERWKAVEAKLGKISDAGDAEGLNAGGASLTGETPVATQNDSNRDSGDTTNTEAADGACPDPAPNIAARDDGEISGHAKVESPSSADSSSMQEDTTSGDTARIGTAEGMPRANVVGPKTSDGMAEGVPARKRKRRRKTRGPKVCHYQRSDGTECGEAAERDGYCMWHLDWVELVEQKYGLPYPDDRASLEQVLRHTVALVLGRKMLRADAQIVLKILKPLERNLKRGRLGI
jgi:hypothetical protein